MIISQKLVKRNEIQTWSVITQEKDKYPAEKNLEAEWQTDGQTGGKLIVPFYKASMGLTKPNKKSEAKGDTVHFI
jgi:hypothetical protein